MRESKTPLTHHHITGFLGAWTGWTLDGMDSVIYALVLSPALTELLPNSGISATPAHIGLAGGILFALFLFGWGLALIWGPIADRFGRTRVLAATIFVYAIFTGAAALSHTVYQLGLFRLLAGIGIGGEWALAGTYVAESWPVVRRIFGAGFLQTGYYVGFFLASALNYTIAPRFGWRAMFLCGLAPVIIALLVLTRVKEPARWQRIESKPTHSPLGAIFSPPFTRKTITSTILVTAAICGLWAGAVYTPTALIDMARRTGSTQLQAIHISSLGMGLLSIGTILGCLAAPLLAEKLGRRTALAIYFVGMALSIALSFGWAFYLHNGLATFTVILFFLGLFGGNFAIFSLWLPEQYPTRIRATAFAFTTSFGRFFAAALSLALGTLIGRTGTLGKPVALTALAFLIGLAAIPFATETRGHSLSD